MTAKAIGIAIMLLNEKPPLFEHTIATINKDETIVAGAEYFLMPMKIGIKLMQVAARAFISMLMELSCGGRRA